MDGAESGLRRDGQAAAVDGFKNFIAPAAKQDVTDIIAKFLGIVEIAVSGFA